MNILILDRNYRSRKPGRRLAHMYRSKLEGLGHDVTSVRRLSEVSDLSRYCLVVAHPHPDDNLTLRAEVEKRDDLYVVINSCNPEAYTELFVRESDRICSFFTIGSQRFIDFLVEKYL